MDTVKSFKGYGKVDEAQDLALKRKTRKRLFLLGISAVVLVGILIGSVVAVVSHTSKNGSPHSTASSSPELTPATSLKAVCSVTKFPDSCVSSISKLPFSNTTDPKVLFKLSLKVAIDEFNSILNLPKKLSEETNDEGIKSSLRLCAEMFDDAIDDFNDTISSLGDDKNILSVETIADIKTWLTAVIVDHETCADGFDELIQFDKAYENSPISLKLKTAMKNSTEFTSISLSIFTRVLAPLSKLGIPVHARRLLTSKSDIRPDITVANDGSGDATSLKAVCNGTEYPDACVSSISKLPFSNSTDPMVLFKLSLKVAMAELRSLVKWPKKLSKKTNDEGIKSSLVLCAEMFDDAMDDLKGTISSVAHEKTKNLSREKIADIRTWLTAVLVDYSTCVDGFDELIQFDKAYANSTISRKLFSAMKNSTESASISLSIFVRVLAPSDNLGNPPIHARRLLEKKTFRPDITVAKDGSGDVKTINEAVARVPIKSKTRFAIYVKSGTYVENVFIGKDKHNVFIYGDGKDKTIISGSKSVSNTLKTMDTATLGVAGHGFMLKDIGVINTAGPENHQAVALCSSSDQSVFYQCSFSGYQDTLYAHRNRQFYRNCDITGTVDFIFGKSTVVFQECNIRPRQPLPNQFNAITAQGNDKYDTSTGIVIHRCTISALDNVTVPTYLGRPWKPYASVFFIESVIGSVVSPQGWVAWNATTDPPQPTLSYGEYKNSGPGSDVTHRVKWAGYSPVMSDAEAQKHSVAAFLDEGHWMTKMQVPYSPNL